MASRLELRRLRDVPAFLAAALRIRRDMLASPGALGLSVIAEPFGRTFWTLSAWQDQAALRAATGGTFDARIMKWFRPLVVGSRFVTWTTASVPVFWDEARRRLENPDTVRGGRGPAWPPAAGRPAARQFHPHRLLG